MENLLLIIVALIIGIAIGYFLFKKLNGGTTSPPTIDPGDIGKPHGVIEVDDAIALHQNYKNTRYNVINEIMANATNNPDFKDTQFVWFSYEKMRKYMRYLEVIQKKNKGNKPISGIRVYFGAYDDNGMIPNQQTVFFTPTIKVDISEEHDNMKNLPFSIIPNNPEEPLVGHYKIIRELLIEEYHADKRFTAALASLGLNTENMNFALRANTENGNGIAENGGDKGTSASFNEGQASPPPPIK